MLGLSNFASREIDRKMIQEVGLPGLVLMEEAALRIYDILKDNYALEGKNVLIALFLWLARADKPIDP